MTTDYRYDSLNRLTNLVWSAGSLPLASFAYTLGATGNRRTLAETISTVSRNYTWQYDPLYRLTNEIVSSTPNGSLFYQYDPVGNRLNRASGLGLSPQSLTYNTNDWLTSDTNDNNGNTIISAGTNYAYDCENRLTNVNNGQVILVYDGDGNRVEKITSTTTTLYLVDTLNPSGYPQVLEELTVSDSATNLFRAYTWGLSLISQRIPGSSTNFYGFDGHGSTRFLTGLSGAIANTYTYDAFGNLINSTGTTPNNFLYCCYQNDPDIGLVFDNARYLNLNTGRFWTADNTEGNNEDPLSLHKYLYAADDPVNRIDPSGHDYGDFDISLSSIGGLLAKIGNPVTSETGLGVFGSDLVLLEAHPVALGVNHSYIALVVGSSSPFFSDPQFNHLAGTGSLHYATLGAGPSFGPWGKLISGVDRPRDLARSTRVFSTEIQPPGGLTEDEFIQMLLNLNSLYDDQANYALFPDNDQDTSNPNFDEYNSNSYASGLLKLATGVIAPQPPNTPGFLFPVPASFFPGAISR